jgi:ribosomal protein S19E (S16A)
VPHIYTHRVEWSIGGTFKIDLNKRISKEIKEKIKFKQPGYTNLKRKGNTNESRPQYNFPIK